MNGRTDPVNYFGKQQPHLVDCSGYSSYNEQQSQGTVSPSHVLQHTYQGNQQPGTISGNFGTSYTDTLKSVSQSVRYHPYHHLQQEQQHNNYVDTSSSSQIQVNYAQHQYSNSLPTSYPIHHKQQVNCCFNDLGGSQQNGSSNFICTSTASYNGNNCNNIEAQALYSGIGSSNAYQTTYQQFSTTKETFTGGSNFQTNCWPSEYKDLAVHPHSTGGFQRTGFLCPQIMDESASSPEVEFEVSPEAKKKGPKKRKKKGANEPQKPVSAYALFFRDTQAAIKAENPNATFGEISKIVASMWDSLSEEAKQVYKQKTETAKRDYLKQLAAYRANLVSRGGLDVDDDSQPLSVLKMQMKEVGNQRQPSLPPMPKLQIAPSRQREWSSMNIPETNLSTMRQNDVTPCPDRISPIPTAGTMTSAHQGIILSSQVNSSNISPSAGSSCVGPPPIQLRNMVPKATSPIAFFPSKPGQVIKVLPASQAASITSSQAGRSRIIKMADMLRPVTTTASRSTGEDTCSVQPILQMLAQESEVGESEGNIQSEPGQNDIHGKLEYVDLTQLPTPPALLSHARGNHQEVDSKPVQMCIRDGCNNFAVSDPQWNDEYCSSECVVTHCRDVFDAWASTRKISASVN